jgi:hypothetical protein
MKDKPRVLTILQHNCNRSTNVMQGIIDLDAGADILAIQEPWIGKKGKRTNVVRTEGRKYTVGHQGYEIIYSSSESRVMWMIKNDSRLVYSVREDV